MLSTTAVVPLQWKVSFSPETCGNRPFAIAGRRRAEAVGQRSVSCAPVRVSITVRFPNGRTANISPGDLPGGSPRPTACHDEVGRRPPELVAAASTSGYFSRIASATMLPISDSLESGRVAQDVVDWVPMTSLRSTAVCSFASSTIAWTSARGLTPMVVASRVAPPAQATSPPRP